MRYYLVCIALLLPAAGAFALDVSGGLGTSLGAYSATTSESAVSGNITTSTTATVTQTPIGITAFLDATYAQVAVGYLVANGGNTSYYDSVGGVNTVDTTLGLDLNTTFLALSAFAKYPFKVGRLVLFPLLGVEYDLNLAYTDANGNDLKGTLANPEDANQLWLKAGAGLDIPFPEFYLRPEVLLGYKFPSQTERNAASAAKAAGAAGASVIDLEVGIALMAGFYF